MARRTIRQHCGLIRIGSACAAALGLAAFGLPARAEMPVGSEFQVSTYTTGNQLNAEIATDADGDTVIVWSSDGSLDSDTDLRSIRGVRYDANGATQGSEFQVNTYTTSEQQFPAAAMDADGDFVVVWHSYGSNGSDSSYSSIQGQRYDRAGNLVGGEFQINSYTTGYQLFPRVASDVDGDFVVVWQSYGSAGTDTSDTSVQGQAFDSSGASVGGQFQVNTYTTSYQRFPVVSADRDGDFVVVWHSLGAAGDAGLNSVQAQRYDASGGAVGGQFQVNTFTTGNQWYPTVSGDFAGNFVVAWESDGSTGTDNDGLSVQARRFDATGSALGAEFQVNTYTTSGQGQPSVAVDADGDWVVTYTSPGSGGTDTDSQSIQAQEYDAAGAAIGSEFQVNTLTTLGQTRASVASDVDGHFQIVWQSPVGAASAIRGQAFVPEPSAALLHGAAIASIAWLARAARRRSRTT